ncbi:hypothetical protein PISMIDRAFT_10079 [Pisolithus microcarpus 441]|uniref:Unplaced genomic scaffold scaffold_30, whole genome shotgun sequence n=1 Tax=Pisolithus microcarpus 441 TaxID=765257 RepID=A0A0C9Z646_9AGAM|nr:hypothetical protein PISMIDRAFT_10079 [Pisolithus microcarpus 441]
MTQNFPQSSRLELKDPFISRSQPPDVGPTDFGGYLHLAYPSGCGVRDVMAKLWPLATIEINAPKLGGKAQPPRLLLVAVIVLVVTLSLPSPKHVLRQTLRMCRMTIQPLVFAQRKLLGDVQSGPMPGLAASWSN